jgi:hypothetical protein
MSRRDTLELGGSIQPTSWRTKVALRDPRFLKAKLLGVIAAAPSRFAAANLADIKTRMSAPAMSFRVEFRIVLEVPRSRYNLSRPT